MPVNYPVYRQLVCFDTVLVGTTRFELATPCTPCKCATGLRYVPKKLVALQRPAPPTGMAKVTEIFYFRFPPQKFIQFYSTPPTPAVTF